MRLFGRRRASRQTFAYTPLDDLYRASLLSMPTSVSRDRALTVPAVRRGRNMLAAISTMPLEQVNEDNEVKDSSLLRQLDLDVPNVVTIAQTVEDLVFDAIAWWRVMGRDHTGYPVAVRRLDPARVSLVDPAAARWGTAAPLPSGVDPRDGVVWIDGKPVGGRQVIRFDSPNPGLCRYAGREINLAITLAQTAGVYADDPRPADYFTPSPDGERLEDDEVDTWLARWKAARKARSTAYIPDGMEYHAVDAPTPQQLQLVELARWASVDIANSLGIDPEDIGVSTTSRTYSNDVDRRRNRLNDVLGPYMRAITDRLSMGDVTPRTRTVRFNTVEYLLPNPTDRWSNYRTAKELGALAVPEIRQAEGMTPLTEAEVKELNGAPVIPVPPPPGPAPDLTRQADEQPEESPTVDASRPPALTFADDGSLTFVDVPVHGFSVDRASRRIEGMVVPYAGVAHKNGLKFRFTEGSLQFNPDHPGRVKLLRDHDDKQAIGVAVQLRDTPEGMLAHFKVARGPAGDEALSLAEDGVLDGLSVGVDFTSRDSQADPDDRSVVLVRRAQLREVSLVAMPAFDDARVTSVAASRGAGPQGKDGRMPTDITPGSGTPDAGNENNDSTPATTATAGGLALTAEQRQAFAAELANDAGLFDRLVRGVEKPEKPEQPQGLTLSNEQMLGFIKWQLGVDGDARVPVEPGPTTVNPNPDAGSTVQLRHEPLPYRFDRRGNFLPAEHTFSTDLHTMALAQDAFGQHTDAGKRVMALFAATFDPGHADHQRVGFVVSGDVNETTPAINLPGMYVDQRDYRTPLWEAVNKGTPPNGTQPFMFPKFSSASGLVGAHTEGTEPTPGTFVTTGQTVTPGAVSGKAVITREVWDMGGNPAVSTLIFQQMVRGYREGLESAVATFLNTLTAATDINLGVATTGATLVGNWDAAVAGLQFERGYDFSMFAIERALYLRFVAAADSDGRKLIPIVNPTNASGRADRRFQMLELAGVDGIPSWALASVADAPNNSWLFDPSVVWGWATPPVRLEFPGSGTSNTYTPVATVDLAIWGYRALANTDIGGVRQVIYDATA